MTVHPSELITMLEQMAANTWPAPIGFRALEIRSKSVFSANL
jgi:hypothetical protein